jgi:predicted Zn finger-like uncharacterized protein
MLIQCHSCNTKYRLNLERMPKRKTFVRCKNCGTPIFIDPTEESEAPAGVLPPQEGGIASAEPAQGARADQSGPVPEVAETPALVACPECQARYRVPQRALQRREIKLKCTQCGLIFPPPAQFRQPAPVQPVPGLYEPGAPLRPAGEPALYPHPPFGLEGDEGPAGAPEMPVPDDGRVEHLFDDLQVDPSLLGARPSPRPDGESLPPEEELGRIADSVFAQEEPALDDPEQAYLEAVDFRDSHLPQGPPRRAGVPDDQKYRFFLNPKEYAGEGQASDPPLPPETDEGGLPPLGPPPERPAMGAQPSASVEGPASPETEPSSPAREKPVEDLPPLPTVQESKPSVEDLSKKREIVAGQEPRGLGEFRLQISVVAGVLAILLVAVVWGYRLASTPSRTAPYILQQGMDHHLVMDQKLEGHYVMNQTSGKRLFVVNGTLRNQFDPQDKIRWIRIKGTAYADPAGSEPLETVTVYAGNRLDDTQLTAWTLEAIRGHYGYTNGANDTNFDVPAGASLPYQLVFMGADKPVARTVAQVDSYRRNGESVYVESQ